MSTINPLNQHVSREPFAAAFGTDISHCDNVEQALTEAGLDWNIEEIPATDLFINNGEDLVSTSIPGRKLLVRSDNKTTLGVVGPKYSSLSNSESFALADAAKTLGATFTYAGELDHGRKAFITMDIPEAKVYVGGHDAVDFGLVLTTDHSGSGSITCEIQGSRLACTNGQLLTSTFSKWSIKHTKRANRRVEMAQHALKYSFAAAKEFAAYADYLISEPMSRQDFIDLMKSVFPQPLDGASEQAFTKWRNRNHELVTLYSEAETQEEGRNTAWGALQTVLEWEQYFRPSRGGELGRAKRNFMTPDNAGIGRRTLELLTAY